MTTSIEKSKNLLIQILILVLILPANVYAQDKKDDKKAEPVKEEAKAEVKEEDDKNIFDKTGGDIWLNKRVSMSPLFGLVLNDVYTNVLEFGAAFNYQLTPRSGVEMTFLVMSSGATDAVVFYTDRFSASPDHNLAKMFIGFDYTYTVFTSSMNFRDSKKMPYLMKVAPGLGMTMLSSAAYSPPPTYPPVAKSQMAITGSLDIIQEFFLSDRLAIRLDFRNHVYPETIYGSNTGIAQRTRLNINTGVMIGASWYCMPSSSKFKFSECF